MLLVAIVPVTPLTVVDANVELLLLDEESVVVPLLDAVTLLVGVDAPVLVVLRLPAPLA